ncbi:hypothetical protein HNP32_003465 [Brevundimonas bullata]|uniref:Uncharacterized protein n=1 Tax=Brevundimonas bullata TaxID=13160 RepID=A0A7W7ISH0_9CAUL|nr:hypothetical protein [Brevundimonas bullata]MBB4799705.1 hypothetical protein [Brevundimonas bullata]MBB6384673.1 hypothetical protein [Brevundimonas bullata]
MTVTPSPQSVVVPVDDLAQEIRRVDGNHSLGAGALAEALLPFLSERLAAAPAPSSLAGGEVETLRTLLDNLVIAQSLSKEIRTHATDEARAYLYDTRLAALSPEAPAREGVGELDELPGDFLARVGMDGALWAEEFRSTAIRIGYPDMDEGWLIGWFCNAVMAGYDHARRRYDPILKSQLAEITGEGACSLSDAIDQFIGDAIANGSVETDRDGVIEWCKPALEQTLVSSLAGCGYGLAALTPRHEAPAEGAGEDNWSELDRLADAATQGPWKACGTIYEHMNCEVRGGAKGEGQAIAQVWDGPNAFKDGQFIAAANPATIKRLIAALRARSSAPEAREEALGNLLAVIHGDGGHRALEVGTKQAALEAEKIVARLLSSAPEAREGEQCCGARYALWMLHLRGPDDIYPAQNYETAVEWADRANSIVAEVRAVPAIWTGDALSHAEGLTDAIQQWEVQADGGQSSTPDALNGDAKP